MFDLELEGKVALVTGGSDGLGRATVERLASAGCKIAVCARREDHLRHACEQITARTGAEILAVPADVMVAADITGFIDAAVQRFGVIDILVNNAGASAAAGFEDVDDAAWYQDIDLKLMACVRACRAVIPHMRKRGGGAIINATIIGGKAAPANALPTSVTRAAGINLTKSLANQYAAEAIRVNTICIGLLKSAQWERRAGPERGVDAIYQELSQRIPLGRVGDAEDYADLVAFLVSKRAAYITGVAVNLDGGMSSVV